MTSSFTTNKNLELQATGDNTNAWGTHLNNNVFTFLDTMLGGVLSISVAGNTDVTLSSGQGQNIAHKLTGALTGNINYIFPAATAAGPFIIDNQTTGAFTVTVKTAAGGSTGVIAPQGRRSYLYNDGTNFSYGVDEYIGINAQTGTSYTALASDHKHLVTFSNGSAIAVSLANAATASGFGNGYDVTYSCIGAGSVTVTPTTSTIGGAATLVLSTGQSARIRSDGTNYLVERGSSSASSGVSSIADGTNGGLSFSASSGAVTASMNVNDLVSKTTPVAADLVAIYDVAGAATKQATAAKLQIAGSGGGTSNFLRADGTWASPGGSGTVTSVGLSLPAIFSVSGSPVTSAGTLTGTLATQAKNLIFAGPSSGANVTPTFRALVNADLPTSGVSQGTYNGALFNFTINSQGIVTNTTANTCFLLSALVTMMDGSKKPLESIRVGEYVRGAKGESNIVEALDRTKLGNRPMYRLNREHWTSPEHPHMRADGKFVAMDLEAIFAEWGAPHPVMVDGRKTEMWTNIGLSQGMVEQMEEGQILLKEDGPAKLWALEKGLAKDWPPETPLGNLVLGGSGTYIVDDYVVTGWPNHERFDYATWKPKDS